MKIRIDVQGYSPIKGQEPADAIIRIKGLPTRIPAGPGWEDKHRLWQDQQAVMIVDALQGSLPQGVLSRVLAILMHRQASKLIVQWDGGGR